jgi:hypothetical protein
MGVFLRFLRQQEPDTTGTRFVSGKPGTGRNGTTEPKTPGTDREPGTKKPREPLPTWKPLLSVPRKAGEETEPPRLTSCGFGVPPVPCWALLGVGLHPSNPVEGKPSPRAVARAPPPTS